jgi:hypothetical protein
MIQADMRQAIVAAYFQTFDAVRSDLHPDDLRDEPRGFAQFTGVCDSGDFESVMALQATVARALARAKEISPFGTYALLRHHYLAYCVEAMRLRWPPAVAASLDDSLLHF